MRDLYPKHGLRRLWYAPWRVVCRCGLEVYPCFVERMVARAAADGDPDFMYRAGLEYARVTQRERGRWWARGAR